MNQKRKNLKQLACWIVNGWAIVLLFFVLYLYFFRMERTPVHMLICALFCAAICLNWYLFYRLIDRRK